MSYNTFASKHAILKLCLKWYGWKIMRFKLSAYGFLVQI